MSDSGDVCVNDGTKVEPGLCGCGFADTDNDGDGVVDWSEVDNLDLDSDR